MNEIIKEFLDLFGQNTTTNFDLIKYAKLLNIKNFSVIMTDEVKDLPNDNFSCILNFQLTSQQGSHWVALYKYGEILYYFDSYGTPIQKTVLDKFKRIRSHNYQIQPLLSNMCGQLSLLVIYLLNNNYKYEDIVLSLKKFFD